MKRALVVVLVAAILAAGGYLYWKRSEASDATLVLSGNVDIREVNLGFRVGGRVATVDVEEGAKVEPGQRIAALDPAPFQDTLAQADAALAAARAAENLLKQGTRAEDIARLKAQADALKIAADNANQTFNRQKELRTTNTSSQQALDDSRAARDESAAQYEAAQQAYLAARNGPRPEEIAQAVAQRQVAEAQRAAAALQLADTTLVSPDRGVVLTRAVEPGSMVGVGTSVVTLSLERPVRIRAYVSEPDLGRVAPGTKVLVYTDSRAGRPYNGTVGFISSRAEFTPKQVETQDLRTSLVYGLRITIDDADDALRQGMPVTVRLAAEAE